MTVTPDGDNGHLRSFIERIENLETEKKALADDIKDVYGEAKGNGFDVKIMRKVVARRRRDRNEVIEEETILELYLGALGDLADTPLGAAAIARDAVNNSSLRRAVRNFGEPTPLTDEEKASGKSAAFNTKHGRVSIVVSTK